MPAKKKKQKVVVASGGFDPIHIGHVEYFKAAKKLGDKLIVLVNNDNWIKLKKKQGFMNEIDRKKMIEAIKYVDKVVLTSHKRNTKDMSICEELRKIKPDIFANGGDRFVGNIPEKQLCEELGIKMKFNVGQGGKLRSSSELLKSYTKAVGKKRKKK